MERRREGIKTILPSYRAFTVCRKPLISHHTLQYQGEDDCRHVTDVETEPQRDWASNNNMKEGAKTAANTEP